jgi:hypothetical protein
VQKYVPVVPIILCHKKEKEQSVSNIRRNIGIVLTNRMKGCGFDSSMYSITNPVILLIFIGAFGNNLLIEDIEMVQWSILI